MGVELEGLCFGVDVFVVFGVEECFEVVEEVVVGRGVGFVFDVVGCVVVYVIKVVGVFDECNFFRSESGEVVVELFEY